MGFPPTDRPTDGTPYRTPLRGSHRPTAASAVSSPCPYPPPHRHRVRSHRRTVTVWLVGTHRVHILRRTVTVSVATAAPSPCGWVTSVCCVQCLSLSVTIPPPLHTLHPRALAIAIASQPSQLCLHLSVQVEHKRSNQMRFDFRNAFGHAFLKNKKSLFFLRVVPAPCAALRLDSSVRCQKTSTTGRCRDASLVSHHHPMPRATGCTAEGWYVGRQ